jgi:hypothetical protein
MARVGARAMTLRGENWILSTEVYTSRPRDLRSSVGADPIAQATGPSVSRLIGSDLTLSDYAELEARWIDRTLAIHAGLRRVDSLMGAEIVGRKSGNWAGLIFRTFIRDPIRFASTDCAGITLSSNAIPPAISNPGRSTSARRAGPTCYTWCPASTQESSAN